MKTLMKYLILPIVVIVVGSILFYLITNKSPNIAYNVTDAIPISITGIDTEEKIQQIQINNIGNDVAKDVRVIIDGKITKFEVQKTNPSDNIKVTYESDVLEIIYPSLIADDEFSISIVSDNGITIEKLSVKHSSGMGKHIYQKRSLTSMLASYTLTLMWIIYFIVMIFFSLRKYYNTESDYEKILKKKKFLSMDEKEILSLKKKAIHEYFMHKFWFSHTISKKIQQCEEKRRSISDEVVRNEYDIAMKKFLDAEIDKALYRYENSEEELIDFLSLDKPSSYEASDWDKKRLEALERLVLCAKYEGDYIEMTKSKVYYYLNGDKTMNLSKKENDFFIGKLNDVFYSRVVSSFSIYKSKSSKHIVALINAGRPKCLTQGKWDDLCDILYGYIIIINNPSDYYFDIKEIVENLEIVNSIKHECDKKKKIIKLLRYIYVLEVLSSVINDSSTEPKLEYDEELLSKENIELLKAVSYSKSLMLLLYDNDLSFEKIVVEDYEWLSERHNKVIKKFHDEFEKHQSSEKRFEEMRNMYNDVGFGRFDGSAYDMLEVFEVEKASELNKIIKENIEGRSVIGKHSSTILRQLDIINSVLGDPTEVKRIEEYDNPFSEKNFENLKYVAELIIKTNEDNEFNDKLTSQNILP